MRAEHFGDSAAANPERHPLPFYPELKPGSQSIHMTYEQSFLLPFHQERQPLSQYQHLSRFDRCMRRIRHSSYRLTGYAFCRSPGSPSAYHPSTLRHSMIPNISHYYDAGVTYCRQRLSALMSPAVAATAPAHDLPLTHWLTRLIMLMLHQRKLCADQTVSRSQYNPRPRSARCLLIDHRTN